MAHDFKAYPELTTSQAAIYYWDSPHKQIFESFVGLVEKVHDGDTIRVKTDFRDFLTTIRFAYINAPEMNHGGAESRDWLKNEILGEEVYIKVNPNNRVGKWGRIIGEVFHQGVSMNDASLREMQSVPFGSPMW